VSYRRAARSPRGSGDSAADGEAAEDVSGGRGGPREMDAAEDLLAAQEGPMDDFFILMLVNYNFKTL
jgi:hypothetical protein